MARLAGHLAMAMVLAVSAPSSLGQTLPLTDVACVPEFNGGNHCTSNALSFEAVSIEPDRTHCDAGDEINLSIGITLGSGKLRNAGITHGFIITKIDKQPVTDPEVVAKLFKSKKGGILVEGIYPNGAKGYFGFGL